MAEGDAPEHRLRLWLGSGVLAGRRRSFVLITAIPTALVLFWCLAEPPEYQAVATVEFDVTLGFALAPGSNESSQLLQEFLETQVAIMTSQTVCAQAERSFPKTKRQATLTRLLVGEDQDACSGMVARRVGRSAVIELGYLDRNPDRAVSFLNAAVDAYFLREKGLQRAAVDNAQEWGLELEQIDTQLDSDQFALAAFSKQYSIGSIESERSLVDAALRSYTDALVEVRVRRIQSASRLSGLELAYENGHMSAFRSDDPMIDQLRQHIQVLEEERQTLGAASDQKHVRLPLVDAELERSKVALRAAAAAALRAAKMETDAARKEEAELQRTLEQARRQAANLLELEAEYARLQRATQRGEAFRDAVLRKLRRPVRAVEEQHLSGHLLGPARVVGQRSWRSIAIALCVTWGLVAAMLGNRRV